VKVRTFAPVMLDGKVSTAVFALTYLDVYTEAAMAQDWHVNVMIQMRGRADFVTFLFATIASMENVLLLASASAILDGRAPTVTSAWHWLDATQTGVVVWTPPIPP